MFLSSFHEYQIGTKSLFLKHSSQFDRFQKGLFHLQRIQGSESLNEFRIIERNEFETSQGKNCSII